MKQHIVVPLNGSPRDAEALDAARNLARHLEASLLLLRVEPFLPSLIHVIADDHQLAEYASVLAGEGFDVHYLLDFGRPDAIIAQTAQQQNDVILLTPQHHRLLENIQHPSVTSGLLSHATVPLFILPEATAGQRAGNLLAGPETLVIVPLDGSTLAEQAMLYAVLFAQAYERSMLLVRVVPTVYIPSVGPETMHIRRKAQLAEDIEARDYLVKMRERLRVETGREAQTLRLHGEPAECLLRLTGEHQGSLMVMSTHGRGGFARALLGSVAAEVVRHSAIPLVIVPPATGSPLALSQDGHLPDAPSQR
jgi:nucleotide-binding universal stress UspA family protein